MQCWGTDLHGETLAPSGSYEHITSGFRRADTERGGEEGLSFFPKYVIPIGQFEVSFLLVGGLFFFEEIDTYDVSFVFGKLVSKRLLATKGSVNMFAFFGVLRGVLSWGMPFLGFGFEGRAQRKLPLSGFGPLPISGKTPPSLGFIQLLP